MPFDLTILGSSSALPTSNSYPTAQVLHVPGQLFLIDCGEGTQMQLRKLKFGFSKINHIFISHLHGDHFYGLIPLISSLNLLGIKKDLHIYSHSDLPELLHPLLTHSKSPKTINPVFHPLNLKKPQTVYENKNTEVVSFPVKHSLPTCGFLFREKQKERNIIKEQIQRYNIPLAKIKDIKKGADFVSSDGVTIKNCELTTAPPRPRSYAFSTDTAFYEPNTKIFEGADLLYHEATFPEEMKDFAKITQHSTAKQAAEMAKIAGVKKLIIGHFSSRYNERDIFLNEAKEIFTNTEIATEGKTFRI